jgi:hypothetical protein
MRKIGDRHCYWVIERLRDYVTAIVLMHAVA